MVSFSMERNNESDSGCKPFSFLFVDMMCEGDKNRTIGMMCTTRDTCDFYCDAFPSRDASQKRIFGFTKMNEKKVIFSNN